MYSSIAQANDAIIERIKSARTGLPFVRPKRPLPNSLPGVNYCMPVRRLFGLI